MTKRTLKQLRESLAIDAKAQGEGPVSGVAHPPVVRDLKTFARQITNALQPNIPTLLAVMEKEFNKYGLTMGEIDTDTPFEDDGDEDYILLQYPDGVEIKNVYVSLVWKRVSTKIYRYRPEVLEYSVRMSINEMDPADFDDMIGSGHASVTGDDLTDGDDVFGDDDMDYVKEAKEALPKWKVKVGDGHTSRTAIIPAESAAEAQKKAVEMFKRQSYIVHAGSVKAEKAVPFKEAAEPVEENKIKVNPDGSRELVIDPKDKFFKSALKSGKIKASPAKPVKKEETNLEEISKEKLGQYIKKSSADKDFHAVDIAKAVGVNRRKWINRKRGIEKAVDKLTKESVEMFQEEDGSLTITLAESMFNISADQMEDFINKFSDFVISEQE